MMEKLRFYYSMKNIPVIAERSYLLKLIKKIEIVIKEWAGKLYIVT